MRKPKENIVGETLLFMLKTVRREKPSLFFLYLLSFITDFTATMTSVILPKFLIDELACMISGMEAQLSKIIIYAAVIVGVALITNLIKNLLAKHTKRMVQPVF